jgi:hypothetical protein
MKKECINKCKASTFKSIFSSTNECEHCGIDIDHCYSLQPKFHPSKSTNNKHGKCKGGHEGGNGFQFKDKASSKVNESGGMAIHYMCPSSFYH